ncbi:MAG: Gfo/Idh/MocA family oxidoreductase [Bdellovibrionota bacterium]
MQLKNNARSLKAGIIGCGQIGSSYDENSVHQASAKTHAKAYRQSSDFDLIGLCDSDPARLATAAKLWNVEHTSTDVARFLDLDLAVISVCVPVAFQLQVLRQIAERPPRALFLEKPVGRNSHEFDAIQKLVDQMDIPVLVNYSRRFSSEIQTLKKDIAAGRWGDPTNVVVNYEKGLLNNGSHALNLLCYFFGNPTMLQAAGVVSDGRENSDDPTAGFKVWFKANSDFESHFVAHNSSHFSVFEIDIFFANGRVRLFDFGNSVQIFSVQADPDYPTYRALFLEEAKSNLLTDVFGNAIQELAELTNRSRKQLTSSVGDSAIIHRVIGTLMKNSSPGTITKL